MKILRKQVLRGPNIWSNYRNRLIQVRLDIGELEDFPTDEIEGFRERIEALLPTLITHECSEMCHGGFFMRVTRGTWMGHVMEHIALEIQTLAGCETGYGRTRGTDIRGVYNMVFSYEIEQVGLYAADAALKICLALVNDQPYDLQADIEEMKYLKARYSLGPSTKSIVDEAMRRRIPVIRSADSSTIQLGYGVNQMKFRATMGCNTSAIAVDLASNKDATKNLLKNSMIPVAEGGVCNDEEGLKRIIENIEYPIVIKPLRGNQGKGATIKITAWNEAVVALKFAQEYGPYVLVEKYITGADFRILVVNNKFVAAAKRIPAQVMGDGKLSIQQLVDIVNSDARRGEGHRKSLTKINIDQDSLKLLQKSGLGLSSIPENGVVVILKSTANLSTGGTAIDVTDEVHPENIFMAERLSKIINLDICGIDIMSTTLSEPLAKVGGVVLEANAAPGFRMHLQPSEGKSRNVAAAVVDMLFPENKPSRIPIVAITGTNGKTTSTRLLAAIAKNVGHKVGYTTTDGIYVNDYLLKSGDTTGPVSGLAILADPTVDFAVLETARGGLLRSGLCFDECDVAILTNIREDHLGLKDINTLEDLANVKAVVVRSVKKDGWAILNADDEHCVKIAGELSCNVAYFSLEPNNPVIKQHLSQNKTVAIVEDGNLVINHKGEIKILSDVSLIPLTCQGTCAFMIANVLGSALAAFLSNFPEDKIIETLQSFKPGIEHTPGRMNNFKFEDFEVLVDYAHNPHGFLAIEDFLKSSNATRKIGVITGVGDRRDNDIIELGVIAQRMFDHVIIRFDKDLRGSSTDRIAKLIIEGLQTLDKKVSYEIVGDELEAVHHVLKMAKKGDYIVLLSEYFQDVVKIIQKKHDEIMPLISITDVTNQCDSVVA